MRLYHLQEQSGKGNKLGLRFIDYEVMVGSLKSILKELVTAACQIIILLLIA